MVTSSQSASENPSEWIGNQTQMDAVLLFFARIALRKHGPRDGKGAIRLPGLIAPSDMQDNPRIGVRQAGNSTGSSRTRSAEIQTSPGQPGGGTESSQPLLSRSGATIGPAGPFERGQ